MAPSAVTTAGHPMQVLILDQNGDILADIDAANTTDALAYYLESRRINPAHAAVLRAKTQSWGGWASEASVYPVADYVYEERNPITGVVEMQIIARAKNGNGHPHTHPSGVLCSTEWCGSTSKVYR